MQIHILYTQFYIKIERYIPHIAFKVDYISTIRTDCYHFDFSQIQQQVTEWILNHL